MYSEEIGQTIQIQLINVALLRFYKMSEYINIVSPFSRIYLITEGEGHLVIGKEKIKLETGYMYFIPAFTACTYVFYAGLSHVYIHSGITLESGLNVSSLFNLKNKTTASELNRRLFFRLLELNPGLELPHHDPHVYQSKPWINKKPLYQSPGHHLETIGIIKQLFSNMVGNEINLNMSSLLKYNIQSILVFIQNNLQNDISVEELANKVFLSKDHFTRVFKSILGLPPCEYIVRKRIEKAQFLLLTTDLSISQIIENTNFKNAPYFSRMFKKYTTHTPGEYRNQRLQNI